jgi:RNA polymerase sigma-70 factor (ECF subfamily)
MTADTLLGRLTATGLAPSQGQGDGRAQAGAAQGELASAPAQLGVAEVYDAHGDYVWRCLRSLGVAPSQLDDAVQDVFVVVHQKLADFDGACALRTWLYAIVIRVARRYRSQLARSFREQESSEAPDPRCSECALESRQALLVARGALAELDDDKREVFVLVEVEQMSAPEAALVLGIPVNTVYSRLRLARLAFTAKLQRRARISRSRP